MPALVPSKPKPEKSDQEVEFETAMRILRKIKSTHLVAMYFLETKAN